MLSVARVANIDGCSTFDPHERGQLLAQISVGRPLLHEHEIAVQTTTTQPGNCSPPPGTYRSGAIECCLFRFQVCLRLSWTSTPLAVGITPQDKCVNEWERSIDDINPGK